MRQRPANSVSIRIKFTGNTFKSSEIRNASFFPLNSQFPLDICLREYSRFNVSTSP